MHCPFKMVTLYLTKVLEAPQIIKEFSWYLSIYIKARVPSEQFVYTTQQNKRRHHCIICICNKI